jgi:hypothetical protein
MDRTESRRDEETGDRCQGIDGQGEERLGYGALVADANPAAPLLFCHDKTMTLAAQENITALVEQVWASVPRKGIRRRRLASAEPRFLEHAVVCSSRVCREGMDYRAAQEAVESEYQKTYGILTPVGMIIIRIVVEIILYLLKSGTEDAKDSIRIVRSQWKGIY